jgi:hypothetical protein
MTSCRGRHDTVIPVSGSQPDRILPRAGVGQRGQRREGRDGGTWKAKETAIEKNENGNVR